MIDITGTPVHDYPVWPCRPNSRLLKPRHTHWLALDVTLEHFHQTLA